MYITHLDLAAFSENLACVELLVAKKAIILPCNKLQDTPLHWAVSGR